MLVYIVKPLRVKTVSLMVVACVGKKLIG